MPFCSLCKSNDHNTVGCPKRQITTHGDPRVVTRQILAPEHVYRIGPPRRKPTWPPSPQPSSSAPSAPSPSSPPSPPASTSSAEPCAECSRLRLRITQLEALLTKAEAGISVTKKKPRNTVTENNSVTGVTKKRGPKSTGNAVTAAERMREYRARKRKS
jgi:hypothetical protein